MKKSFFETIQTNQRLTNWSLELLISLMMVCLAISVMQFGQRLGASQNWSGWYLPVFTWLVSLEAMLTKNKTRELDTGAKILYHLSEWVIFAILLKVFHYLMVGPEQLWIDLPTWQQNPVNFFSGEYLPIMLVLFITWLLTGSMSNDIEELQIEQTDLKWELGKLENNRQEARQRMAEKIFLAGGAMVFITMLTRLDLQQLWGETPASQASTANVLVYFLLTLVFLSLTQFSLLRGRWFWNQLTFAPEIAKKWLKFSFIFFALLAAIAFILPTRYTFGFLEVLQFVFNGISQVMLFIFSVLTFPCVWLVSLIKFQTSQSPEGPPPQPPKLDNLLQGGPSLPWWELVKSILFWAIFVGIVSFAFVNFLRQHPGLARSFRRIPGFGWLFGALKTLWEWLRGVNKQIASTITSGWQRIFRSGPKIIARNLGQLINFRQLSPRQQVVFFYLRLLDKSKQSGIDRKPYQTPDQFAADLEQFIPEVQHDVHNLTDTFVEARYSNHPIGNDHTSLVQMLWRRIVRKFRAKKTSQ